MNNLENKNKEEIKVADVVPVELEKEESKLITKGSVTIEPEEKELDDLFGADDDDDFVEIEGKLFYELKVPIVFEGEEITELSFDFENLNGSQLKKVLMEVRALIGPKKAGQELVVPSVNIDYQCGVAARACGKKIDLMYKLKARDFTAITTRTSNFLLGAK